MAILTAIKNKVSGLISAWDRFTHARLVAALKASQDEARRNGLTEEMVQEELAAYKRERREQGEGW